MSRKVTLTDDYLKAFTPTPCPKCGNNREFIAHSQRSGEDCCDVWVECGKCGYDPTAEKFGYRFEDVWGGTGDENVMVAISCWDDAIAA